MNLRIADWPGLVAFLHRTLTRDGEPLLSVEGLDVLDVDGRLFYCGRDPLTVGGPFASLEALVRSEGLRRYVHPPGPNPRVEVFEWGGAFFRVEASEVERHPDLESAKRA